MINFTPLYYFSVVAQYQSFQKASTVLNISPSAISHAITTLEKNLQLQLLHRTTRHVSVTPEGQIVLNSLLPSFNSISQAIEQAKETSNNLTGHLKITAPRSLSQIFLIPIIQAFTTQYPQVHIELHSDDALISHGYDVGLRFDDALEQDMVVKKLNTEIRTQLVASKNYLTQYGTPQHPNDLLSHRCIGRKFPSGQNFLWEFMPTQPQFCLTFTDSSLIADAVKRDLGIGYIFEHFTEGLVPLLPQWTQSSEFCYLYWSKHTIMRPVVRHFIDFIQEWNLNND